MPFVAEQEAAIRRIWRNSSEDDSSHKEHTGTEQTGADTLLTRKSEQALRKKDRRGHSSQETSAPPKEDGTTGDDFNTRFQAPSLEQKEDRSNEIRYEMWNNMHKHCCRTIAHIETGQPAEVWSKTHEKWIPACVSRSPDAVSVDKLVAHYMLPDLRHKESSRMVLCQKNISRHSKNLKISSEDPRIEKWKHLKPQTKEMLEDAYRKAMSERDAFRESMQFLVQTHGFKSGRNETVALARKMASAMQAQQLRCGFPLADAVVRDPAQLFCSHFFGGANSNKADANPSEANLFVSTKEKTPRI